MYNYRYSSGRSAGNSIRSDVPLSDYQIAAVAPSVFAQAPHHSRKNTYTMVPTGDVLARLRLAGFEPFEARQTRCRKEDKQPFTRHMLRLRHPDMINLKEITPEIILLNSHDGTSSYQLLTGFFRSICDNGLVAGNVHSDMRIAHRGNIGDNVIDGCITVVEQLDKIASRVDEFQSKILSLADQSEFARRAMELRWGDKQPFQPLDLVLPRRFEDNSDTLWQIYNRVQENMLKGGLAGKSATGRRTRSRGIKAIDADIKVNRGLWDLAEEFMEV